MPSPEEVQVLLEATRVLLTLINGHHPIWELVPKGPIHIPVLGPVVATSDLEAILEKATIGEPGTRGDERSFLPPSLV